MKSSKITDYISGVVLGIMLFLTLTVAPLTNEAARQSGQLLSASIESP